MSKLFLSYCVQKLLIATLLIGVFSTWAMADDRFAVALGAHDNLVILGPNGERKEISAPTIASTITVGSTSFQVSYGRDANDLLTAVLTPSPSQPQDLHFSVLNKTIDSTKQAVVTLTFSSSQHVTVDPGYVGTVTVNSQSLRHHDLAETTVTPRHVVAKPVSHTVVQTLEPQATAPAVAPAPVPRAAANITPRSASESTDSAPPIPHSAMAPPIKLPPIAAMTSAAATPDASAAAPAPKSATGTASAPKPTKMKLRWAGPVTPLHGPPPAVGVDEMKLVQVHGKVSVTTPDGKSESGEEGMIVPTGSAVTTEPNSSAAVFMGGVNSARLLPNSSATVNQSLEGTVRKTTINLSKGTVFNRVGRRDGETQDYKVHTPQGVAAARGTEFSVTILESGGVSYTVTCTKQGLVTLTDNSNGKVIRVTPLASAITQVAVGSVPVNLSPVHEASILINLLLALQPFNENASDKDNVSSCLDVDSSIVTSLIGSSTASSTVHNANGTTTTTTTTTTGSGTVITTSVTTDSKGVTVGFTNTVTTTNPDGTTSTSTTETQSDGTTTTTTTAQTTTNQTTGASSTTSTTTTQPSSGTLNSTINEGNSTKPVTPF